jgi:VIT1/CCC1 family predicted Fe2+/Mn2+ transporter
VVRVAGLAGLVAGSISMAAGEYNSVRVQNELFERELELERIELHRNPEGETEELAGVYEARGVPGHRARELAQAMMADPDLALEVHAKEELGFAPNALASPISAAVSSFFTFSLGAVIPLLPWFVSEGAAVAVGWVIAASAERPVPRVVLRQLLFTLVPAGITYAVGSALGVSGVG